MCGFIAQLVEHRTGIAEVTGSNPVEALIFFRLLLSNCLNWKIYCDDHSSLSFTTAVQIWIISYKLHNMSINRTLFFVSHQLVPGTCSHFDGLVNISCFRALQVLEVDSKSKCHSLISYSWIYSMFLLMKWNLFHYNRLKKFQLALFEDFKVYDPSSRLSFVQGHWSRWM